MSQVLDYSAGQPGAGAIRAAGYLGAVRYIGFPDRRKCTTAAELADFGRVGLGMALVYEDNADDWRGGYARGVDAGRRARGHASAIGFPPWRPIYMAVDRDVVTEAEFRTVLDYLRGAATTLGGLAVTGVYGEHDVCARAAAAGVATWFWQCRAWSGTPVRLFAGRHLYQRTGTVRVGSIPCDINDVLAPDWGQHNATAPIPINTEEDSMLVPSGENEHVSVIVAGKTRLYLGCGYDRKVFVHQIDFFGDTPGEGAPAFRGVGGGYTGAEPWVFEPNRPGPVPVPPGAAQCIIRYTADHPFTVGAVA